MTEDAMARLRCEIVAEREKSLGTSDEEKVRLQAALRRKQDQVTRIVTAITDAGHNLALLVWLVQLEGEAEALRGELEALTTAEPPTPLEMPDDINTLIQAAARDIEKAISHPSHPDGARLREMVRSMFERITINPHESGATRLACAAPLLV